MVKAPPAESGEVNCQKCAGNGEIVADWDRYLEAKPGDVGDEAVAECPECSGTGKVDAASQPVDHRRVQDAAPARPELDALIAEAKAKAPQPGAEEGCMNCAGNGEIVTDWDRYLKAHPGDVGDEAVAECPECSGTGKVDAAPQPGGAVKVKAPCVDVLAQEIRRVDGEHQLGAGALAEALIPFISAAATSPSGWNAGAWQPTHRHVKRGSEYRVLGEAKAQVSCDAGGSPAKWRNLHDGNHLTVYQGADGNLWVRFSDEFSDGRFQPLPTPPAGEG